MHRTYIIFLHAFTSTHIVYVCVCVFIPVCYTCFLQSEPVPPGTSALLVAQEPTTAALPIGEIRSISTVTADRRAVWQSRVVSVFPHLRILGLLFFHFTLVLQPNWPVILESVTVDQTCDLMTRFTLI